MPEPFVRVEGTVPETTKEWIELESMKTTTPIKTIVGNAIALYKSQNDGSNLGQRKELLMICERKSKQILQNFRENMVKNGKNMPDLLQYTNSCAVLLVFLDKKTPKNQRESINSLYRSVIADYSEALIGIKYSDAVLYTECVKILRKSVHKSQIDYFDTLLKFSRDSEAPIIYVGGTLDNNTFESEIIEMAANCMTVPIKTRDAKIQHTMKIISDTFETDKISEYISIFQNELKNIERKGV